MARRRSGTSIFNESRDSISRRVRANANCRIENGMRKRFSASDVVQETLFEIWKGRKNLEGIGEEALVAYTSQVGLNVLNGLFRKNLARKRSLEIETSLNEDQGRNDGSNFEVSDSKSTSPLFQLVIKESLEKICSSLDKRDKAVLELRLVQNVPYDKMEDELSKAGFARIGIRSMQVLINGFKRLLQKRLQEEFSHFSVDDILEAVQRQNDSNSSKKV